MYLRWVSASFCRFACDVFRLATAVVCLLPLVALFGALVPPEYQGCGLHIWAM